MRRYNQRLFRVARAIVRDDVEAEDILQHAYVSAFTHLHQFAGMAAFSTWLTRIVSTTRCCGSASSSACAAWPTNARA